MVELGEDFALPLKAEDDVGAGDVGAQDLDRDILLECFIGAAGQIDAAHASPAKLPEDFVVGPPPAFAGSRVGAGYLSGARLPQRCRSIVSIQQADDIPAQVIVRATG